MPSGSSPADLPLSDLCSVSQTFSALPAPACPQAADCIVTAAGLSSRMGRWKMMLPWGDNGETLLDVSLRNALYYCHRVILVTGFRGAELAARYRAVPRITVLHHPDYEQGLLSSQRLAAQAVTTPYCFLTHGDVPFLTLPVWQALWEARSDAALLPRYKQVPGHPVLLTRDCLLRALALDAGNSMKKRLLAGPHRFLEMDTPAVITDIDTPEAYQQHYQG